MPGNDEGRPPPGDEPAHIEALQPTEPPTSSDSNADSRQAALELAAAAWEVFPCKWTGPYAKAPMTMNGHLNATTDPDQIKLWWTKWPNAMIGAKVPDSLLVIDLDP
jgi:Bifunctional DNA primase/polymerase, N-terminal